ncbi:MAG: hypothetical protein WBY88_01515 [Desulfosarcina sp.]
MNQHMTPTIPTGHGQPRGSFGRSRLYHFGLTMVVMGASFILYYLGLFGTVDGPLSPDNVGAFLSGLGVTRHHVIMMLLSILIFALSWNWVFNLTSAIVGARMTCKAGLKEVDGVCGAPVKRTRRTSKRSRQTVVEYVCPHGHRRSDAHFHPVKKGTISNTVWVACLAFVLISVLCV